MKTSSGRSNASFSESPTSNMTCPHKHFRAKLIDRDQLDPKDHIALLATPRGYRWNGSFPPNYKGPKSFSLLKPARKKNQDDQKTLQEAEQRYMHQFVSQIFPLMSSEMLLRLKRMLIVEFGMTPKKAGEFIKKQNSAPQKNKKSKPKKSFEVDVNVKELWLKEFERLLKAKITDYLISLMCARLSNKVETIAENVLHHICDITGEWCSLNDPQNRVQRIQVFFAERFAVWLANQLEKADKTICEEYTNWQSGGKRQSSVASSRPSLEEEKPKKKEEKSKEEDQKLKEEEDTKKETEPLKPHEEEEKKEPGEEKEEEKPKEEDQELKEEQEEKEEEEEKPKEQEETIIDEEEKPEEVMQEEEKQKEGEEQEQEQERIDEEEREKELEEQKRKEEEEKRKEEEEKLKDLEEQKRREEEERQKELEEQKRKEEEEKRKEEEEKQMELEKKRREEEEREKELEELKRKEEEERREEEERKQKELEDQQRREEEERLKELEEQKRKEEEELKEKEEEYESEMDEEDEDLEEDEVVYEEADLDQTSVVDVSEPVEEEIEITEEEKPDSTVKEEVPETDEDKLKESIADASEPEKQIPFSEPDDQDIIEDQLEPVAQKPIKTRGAYRVMKNDKGCFYEVKEIDDKEICNRTKIARKKRLTMVPTAICERPETSTPIKTADDMKKWSNWASGVVNFVEKWSKWIETTSKEVEAKAGGQQPRDDDDDYRKFKEKTEMGVLELRRNKKYIKESSKDWKKKLNEA